MKISQQYREVESKLKQRARYYGYTWRIDPSDLESVAREAFMRAVETYSPEFGTSRSTWQLRVINQMILDECKRLSRNRKREIVGEDYEDFGNEFCVTEIELDNDIANHLSDDSKMLLNHRMSGYPDYKLRALNWRGLAKAQIELTTFAQKLELV